MTHEAYDGLSVVAGFHRGEGERAGKEQAHPNGHPQIK